MNFKGISFRLLLTFCAALLAAACGSSSPAGGGSTTPARIGHVFVVVLENEDFATSFGQNSPAPYLAQTLPSQGVLLTKYYGIGHNSLDNYIAMISGQAPNVITQADCPLFLDFIGTGPVDAVTGQAIGQGCVFPATVKTVADQLETAKLSWKGYMEDMGNDPSRGDQSTCGHPAVNAQDNTQSANAKDQYATRHDPFVYFHGIIDDQARCDAHVVNLEVLKTDLASAATTPNLVFITPDLCHDGHDASCADTTQNGGLKGINDFLTEWMPRITSSPAYQQDGLLIVTFDEASTTDASACCGEAGGPPTSPNTPLPGITGSGGGIVGAVMLSQFIKPGTTSTQGYNHYSLLRSVEDIFGLAYLGNAGASGQASFGADVYTQQVPEFPAKP